MIVGLESNSKIFTVSVHGLLELQVNCTLLISATFCTSVKPHIVLSPAGWAVHLHICGQCSRRFHYNTEWFWFYGNAARRIASHRNWSLSKPATLIFSTDCLLAPPHSSDHKEGLREGSEADIDSTAWQCDSVKNSRIEFVFHRALLLPGRTWDTCYFTSRINWK